MTAEPFAMPAVADIARETARLRSGGENAVAALLELLHRHISERAEIGVPCPVCDGTGSFDWQSEKAGCPAPPCGYVEAGW
jgi:hypothetical protein